MKPSNILKLFLMLFITHGGFASVSMAQTTAWLTSNMPHYHEFNTAQNPNGYGWCGHTALKIAMQYKTGQVKTLNQIHNTFYTNSAGYRANTYCGSSGFQWCSKLQDLMWAGGLSQIGCYGDANISQTIGTFGTSADFFMKVKNAINLNQPVIVPSNWRYPNVGHYWVIVGYTDWGSLVEVLFTFVMSHSQRQYKQMLTGQLMCKPSITLHQQNKYSSSNSQYQYT